MNPEQEIREILEDFDASFAEKSEGGREEVYKEAIEALSTLITTSRIEELEGLLAKYPDPVYLVKDIQERIAELKGKNDNQ